MATGEARRYRLTDTCTLILQRGDITKFAGDAIVNAANERMLGGGGVDGAIHRAAGTALYHACKEVPEVEPGVRCPTGEARITGGFALPAKHVIHAVGPVYKNAAASAPLLEAVYANSLKLANQHGLKTIAYPAISCGVFGYPFREAAEIAIRTAKKEAGVLQEIVIFLMGGRTDDPWSDFAAVADAELQPL